MMIVSRIAMSPIVCPHDQCPTNVTSLNLGSGPRNNPSRYGTYVNSSIEVTESNLHIDELHTLYASLVSLKR